MRERIAAELDVLRQHYEDLDHRERGANDWFRIPRYRFPDGWELNGKAVSEAEIAFMVNASYPANPPYAFLAPEGLTSRGTRPNSASDVGAAPPFAGRWTQFSWQPDEPWAPAVAVLDGSNLLHWARSFGIRLREGA